MTTQIPAFFTIVTLAVAPTAPAQTAPGSTSAPSSTSAPAPPVGTTREGVQQPPAEAPAAAASSPQRKAAAALPADYRLAIGDKLRVEVYKDAQLSQSLQVRPDGKITLPLVGDITAAGLSSIELRDQIASALKEYVTNPVVTVIVVETVPPVIYVMGEVANPGAVALNSPMSVLQALAMAGGFRDFANTKEIRVLRQSARGVQTIGFNYKSAVKGDGNPVLLQPGDTVIVP